MNEQVCCLSAWLLLGKTQLHLLSTSLATKCIKFLILTFFRKVQIHLNVCHTEAVQKLFDQRKVSELFYIPEHMPTTGFCLSGSFLCDTQCCPENKLNIIRSDIIKEKRVFFSFFFVYIDIDDFIISTENFVCGVYMTTYIKHDIEQQSSQEKSKPHIITHHKFNN